MKIALIGAGPRNLAVLDRLIQKTPSNQSLTVDLFDPYPVGGRVWNPFFKDNQTFLMNTFANQVTLFNDYDNNQTNEGSLSPNLLSWAQSFALEYLEKHPEYDIAYREEIMASVTSNTHTSRGLMGVYAAWFFEQLSSICPENISINFHQETVTDLTKTTDGFLLTVESGESYQTDDVVFAPGHLDAKLTDKKKDLAHFAQEKSLHYYPASHPAENDFSALDNNDTVLIQGLGLSAFDDLLTLTAGKGGIFLTKKDGSLSYQKSGHEPHLVIGSGSGLPPRAHGTNQKGASELYHPLFFTLPALKAIAAENNGKVPYSTFRFILNRELTYKYLVNSIHQLKDLSESKKAEVLEFIKNPDNWLLVNDEFNLNLNTEISWDKQANPTRDMKSGTAFKKFFIQHLKKDIQSAQLGNQESPLTGAYDILRDLRGTVRYLYDNRYFDEDDYQKLLTDFKLFDTQLSVGPPLIRIQQLLALIEAKIVTITGPNFSVAHDDQSFIATDRFGDTYHGTALIEARLGRIDFRTADSPLIQSLRQQGLITGDNRITNPDGTELLENTIKVDPATYQVIDHDNQLVKNFFITGIPLEGQRWFTTVIPRPHTQTIAFVEAATVVNQIFAK